MHKLYKKTSFIFSVIIILAIITISPALFTKAADNLSLQNARIDTSSAGLSSKVAPGDFLPISIKLLNFGGGKKVDVIITYTLTNNKKEIIYSITETVAVETTASFVKNIQIPPNTPVGNYTAQASITYQDQIVPATTEFSFTVENRLFGLFRNELMIYGGVTLLASILMGILGRILVKKHRISRFKPLEYSEIPRDKRVFYELISDTVLNMRERVGDVAIDIASHIEGLVIDENTGKVLKISKSPSKIIAVLVDKYEKTLNQKVSFSFRNEK